MLEERNIAVAKSLVSFYNMQTGSANRLGKNESRIQMVLDALDRAGGSVPTLKNAIRDYAKEQEDGKRDPWVFFGTYMPKEGEVPFTPSIDTPAQTPAPNEQAVGGALGILEQAVIKIISDTQTERIESEIMESVEQKVRDFIKDEYGSIERKITTVVDGVPRDMKGIQHEKFETILKFVANDEPVLLVGPAGSGKNVICKQVAEALGIDFYFTNAVTQEYKLTGFTDANGNYQPTQFYKAFTEGGVFMLDEIDASIPEVLVILNAAIANKYFDFPAPIGYVEAHPNFRVVAAGNTYGTGADSNYVGRNQLDGASLDRFAVIHVDYSEAIENAVSNGDNELVAFARDVRQAAEKSGVEIIVSYRAIGRMAKMVQILSLEEMLETCLTKGLERDDIHHITTELKRPSNKYARGLNNLVSQMAA